ANEDITVSGAANAPPAVHGSPFEPGCHQCRVKLPRNASAQNNSPCGEAWRGGTKREVSRLSSRARQKPCRRQATAKRRRSRSANTPEPCMRVEKLLS